MIRQKRPENTATKRTRRRGRSRRGGGPLGPAETPELDGAADERASSATQAPATSNRRGVTRRSPSVEEKGEDTEAAEYRKG